MADWSRMSKRSKAATFDFYGIPHSLKPAKPRQASGKPDEAGVVRAVSQLLGGHPKVLFALRMNSGAASYEAKSGRYAPIWFHKWVRSPEPCRMSDFIGATIDFRMLAIECKRPGWSKPTDQREREQSAFLSMVLMAGGRAAFITDVEQVNALLAL